MAARTLLVLALGLAFGLLLGGEASAKDRSLLTNSSFELGARGWIGRNAKLGVTSVYGAPRGRRVAVLSSRSGRFFVLDDRRRTKVPVTRSDRLTASVLVRAHNRRSRGAVVSLRIIQRSAAGRIVGTWRKRSTAKGRFVRLGVRGVAKRRGASVEVRLSVGRRGSRPSAVRLDDVVLSHRRSGGIGRSPGGDGVGSPGAGGVSVPAVDPLAANGAVSAAGGVTSPAAPPFSPGSPFNSRLSDGVPLDDRSASKISAIMGYGDPRLSYKSWSPAVYQGSPSDPLVEIRLRNVNGWGPNPLHGKRIHIPAGAAPPTDASSPDNHMSIVSGGVSHSLWRAESVKNGVLWATWGGMAPLWGIGSNLPESPGGRGSGLNQIAGLITPRDIEVGEIRHALAIGVRSNLVSTGHVSPAITSDGAAAPGATTVKEGQRLRLPADVDVNAVRHPDPQLQAFARMLTRALRDYGAFVVDRSGSSLTFYMTNPISWTSLGQPNPWPARIGPENSSGSYDHVFRETAIPWERLQVIDERHGA